MGGGLVILRPSDADNRAYIEAARTAGLNPMMEPILSVVPVDADFSAVPDGATLVATSVNALKIFASADSRRSFEIVTVGPDSAAAANRLGFEHIEPGPGRAADLPDFLSARQNNRLVYLRGQDISHDIAQILRDRGHKIEEIVVYRTETAQNLSIGLLQALDRREIEAVCVFSVRGGIAFAELIEQYGRTVRLKPVKVLCLSEAVLQSVSVLPFQQAYIAGTPDRHGMIELVERIAAYKESV